MIDRLEKLKGAAFDREYVRDMVQDHQKDVQEFQKEAQSGSNPQLKAFAQETLPTLQQHLQMAQQLESKMGSAHSSAAPAR
jgi:putative membrane protein